MTKQQQNEHSSCIYRKVIWRDMNPRVPRGHTCVFGSHSRNLGALFAVVARFVMSLSYLYNTVSSFMQKMKNMSKTRDARGPTLKLKAVQGVRPAFPESAGLLRRQEAVSPPVRKFSSSTVTSEAGHPAPSSFPIEGTGACSFWGFCWHQGQVYTQKS